MSAPFTAEVTQPALAPAWGEPNSVTVQGPASAEWITPGFQIARAIAHRPEVRMVLERLEADRYAVFVILDADPEDLLDEILDAERRMSTEHRALVFDLRIMKPSATWSDTDLRRASLVRWERLPTHARG